MRDGTSPMNEVDAAVGVRRGSTLRNTPREGTAKTADRVANFDQKCTVSGRITRRRTVEQQSNKLPDIRKYPTDPPLIDR
ncbi:hypothetical protein ALP87_01979 [Pseudomonas syringae pv. coriandricola]|nr:hypothetical protein ALP87_01979 [Pseudomonas syringae pv. coriandricola]